MKENGLIINLMEKEDKSLSIKDSTSAPSGMDSNTASIKPEPSKKRNRIHPSLWPSIKKDNPSIADNLEMD